MSSQDRRKSNRRKNANGADVERRQSERRTGAGDRREYLRVPLELWMEEIIGEEVYFRRTGNVSLGGVYFENAIPHGAGTEITLKFVLPGDQEMVVARGEVLHPIDANEDRGMRVRFISIEGDGDKRMRTFMEHSQPQGG